MSTTRNIVNELAAWRALDETERSMVLSEVAELHHITRDAAFLPALALLRAAAEPEAKGPVCMAANCETVLATEDERINAYCAAHEWRDVPPSRVLR